MTQHLYNANEDRTIRDLWTTVPYQTIAHQLHRSPLSVLGRAKKHLMLEVSKNPPAEGQVRRPVGKRHDNGPMRDYHAPPASLIDRLARPAWFDEDVGAVALRRKAL